MSLEINITDADDFFLGEHKVLKFPITDSNGSPINVSAWTFRWELKKSKPGHVFVTKTSAPSAGITVTGAGSDTVQVTLTAADTSELPAGTYYIALWRTDTDQEQVLSFGTAVLKIA